MLASCFTRDENDGIRLIFPITGPRKQNSLLVNATVFRVYEQVTAGAPLADVRRDYLARAARAGQAPSSRRVAFDLYRILLHLKDHGLCEYAHDELATLLPPGRPIASTTQVTPIVALDAVSALVVDACRERDGARFFFAPAPAPDMSPAAFVPEALLRRHLTAQETSFVQLDAASRPIAASGLIAFGAGTETMRVSCVAARAATDAEFADVVTLHLRGLIALLGNTTIAPLLRFQKADGAEFGHCDASFTTVLAALGFRRAFRLADEILPGVGMIAWDRTIGVSS